MCFKFLFTTHRNSCQSPLINSLTSDVDLDNNQVENQYKKKEIKPRSNWNKKSASPYCESLTARMQPADFGDPKLFKVVYMLSKILQFTVRSLNLFQSEQLTKWNLFSHKMTTFAILSENGLHLWFFSFWDKSCELTVNWRILDYM